MPSRGLQDGGQVCVISPLTIPLRNPLTSCFSTPLSNSLQIHIRCSLNHYSPLGKITGGDSQDSRVSRAGFTKEIRQSFCPLVIFLPVILIQADPHGWLAGQLAGCEGRNPVGCPDSRRLFPRRLISFSPTLRFLRPAAAPDFRKLILICPAGHFPRRLFFRAACKHSHQPLRGLG